RDDEIINIPNALLNSTKITNQSAPVETKRIRVPVGVAYGTDIERLEEALLDVAEQEELVVEEPEPRPMFREFGDSSLD
ncbi:MAG: mechanosensitive ion channel, partial [Candidatus Nanohaloarchaea archaeon]|nr:mechanosensitive ion channel [Candidatus Nanohaloarchaea archaeon]